MCHIVTVPNAKLVVDINVLDFTDDDVTFSITTEDGVVTEEVVAFYSSLHILKDYLSDVVDTTSEVDDLTLEFKNGFYKLEAITQMVLGIMLIDVIPSYANHQMPN